MAATLLVLSACTNANDLHEPMVDLGDFRLGHDVVVASKMRKGPFSRDVGEEEMIQALTGAMEERFRRYDGTGLYHIGISVEGYVVAMAGIPLLLKPRSALITKVTVWDDQANAKLNEVPKTIEVLESFGGDSFILGTGLTMSKEEQLHELTRNVAKEIQNWLQENPEWFTPEPGTEAIAATTADVEVAETPRYFGEGVVYDVKEMEAANAAAEATESGAVVPEEGSLTDAGDLAAAAAGVDAPAPLAETVSPDVSDEAAGALAN
ncbi:hypothetical protein [Pseudooceanicola algae]|nr:hypothetical protein [Pseudooceanicola algae]